MDKLAILTVNYKNKSVTNEFIQSLTKQKSNNFKLFIADTSPEKETFHSDVINIETLPVENRGYAFGINAGIKAAQDEGFTMFAVINNDTEVGSTFVADSIKAIKKHSGHLVGGKIYYASGYEYHKDRYKKLDLGKVIWYAGGIVDWDNAYTKHRGVDEVDAGQYDSPEQTEFVTGCLMLFDEKLLDVAGMMDDSYFLYYEDADWCERVKRSGRKLFYDPSVVIWHKNAQSTSGSGSDLHQRYQEKNRIKYGLRYAPLRTKLHLLINYVKKTIS